MQMSSLLYTARQDIAYAFLSPREPLQYIVKTRIHTKNLSSVGQTTCADEYTLLFLTKWLDHQSMDIKKHQNGRLQVEHVHEAISYFTFQDSKKKITIAK